MGAWRKNSWWRAGSLGAKYLDATYLRGRQTTVEKSGVAKIATNGRIFLGDRAGLIEGLSDLFRQCCESEGFLQKMQMFWEVTFFANDVGGVAG